MSHAKEFHEVLGVLPIAVFDSTPPWIVYVPGVALREGAEYAGVVCGRRGSTGVPPMRKLTCRITSGVSWCVVLSAASPTFRRIGVPEWSCEHALSPHCAIRDVTSGVRQCPSLRVLAGRFGTAYRVLKV